MGRQKNRESGRVGDRKWQAWRRDIDQGGSHVILLVTVEKSENPVAP